MSLTAEAIRLQREKWLSMRHIGDARPTVRVFVRKGHLERKYRRLSDDQVFAYIPGLLTPNDVWFGEWVADTDYVEVPNIKEVKGDQDYTTNGVETLTLTLDNIAMIEEEGHLGAIFHAIQRGFMSPTLGDANNRGERTGKKNSWFEMWKDKSTQVMVIGGYGTAVFPLHVGLVDKTSITTKPDTIVATIRNMGQFLTDQDVFMDAKNLWLRDPITFADRVAVQEGPNIANSANAKSSKSGAGPGQAVDGNTTSAWVSAGGDEMQWIEFPLSAAHLIKQELYPAYPGMEMYISVFTTNNNVPGGGNAKFGNGEALGEGWVNAGKGNVPGTTIPWVNHLEGVRESMTTYPLVYSGQKIISGDETKVRLWFRNLHNSPTDDGKGTTKRAGVREFRIRDASVPEEAENQHWILVDDVSDIVKVVLQWVGITDWEVEKTGVRLADKVVFDRTKKLIDIINYVKEQVSYIFYVRAPEEFDLTNLHKGNKKNLSMGVAVFRQPSAMQENTGSVESVRDDNLLLAPQAEFDSTQLPDSIRVRGKAVSDKVALNDPTHIHKLGADRTQRYQASYRPVWARKRADGQGHLRKPELHYDYTYQSVYECSVACLLIAYQAALASAKGEIDIPMWPLINLDDQTLLFDRATGLSTRLWNIQRSWIYIGGENVEFKMSLGGSFIDTNDVAETREELVELLNEGGRMPAPIARGPWTSPHLF